MAVCVLVALMLVLATSAEAHATLVASVPAAGEQLDRTPATVVLTFDEGVEIAPGSLRVLDPAGADLSRGVPFHPHGDATAAGVRTAALPRGRYVVAWRVVSADSHIVSGAYTFGIGEPAGDVPTALLQAQEPAAPVILAVLHFALLASILLGVGLFAASVLVALPGETIATTMVELAAWSVLGFVAFAQVFVQADFAGGTPLAAFATRYGVLRIVLIVAAILGFAALTKERRRRGLLALAGAIALMAEALSGHAATGAVPFVGVVADLVHEAGAALWLGVLLTTLFAPRHVDVRRVSNVALWCVIAIALSAIPQGVRNVHALDALVSTTYGLLVCAKIALFVLTLAVAWVSRRGVDRGVRAITASVWLEAIVLTAVIAVTAVLLDAPPARTSAAPAVVAHAAFHVDDVLVNVETQSGDALHESFRITTASGGVPRDVDAVSASMRDARTGAGPITLPVRRIAPGISTGDVTLPFAGRWTLFVSVRVGPFDEDHATLAL